MGRKLLMTLFSPSASSRQVLTGTPLWPILRVRFIFCCPGLGFLTPPTVGYMKRVKENLAENGTSPEEIKAFEDGAKKFVGSELTTKSFKENKWDFYIGEGMDVNGMYVFPPPSHRRLLTLSTSQNRIVLLNYREDGKTPYMIFWKHGLKEEKV